MNISEKLDNIYDVKKQMSSLYDECGFEGNNMLSNHSLNLSNIILSVDLYDKFIDENWKGNIYRINGEKIRQISKLSSLNNVIEENVEYIRFNSYMKSLSKEIFKDNQSLLYADLNKISSFIKGNKSFTSCYNVLSIIGDNLMNDQNDDFSYCTSLEYVYLPNLRTLTDRSFLLCINLKDLELLSLSSIKNLNFQKCYSLSNVNFPNLVSIGSYNFRNCNNLESIDLNNLRTLADSNFSDCQKLSSISLNSLSSINGQQNFQNSSKLTTLNLQSIRYIKDGAFAGNTSLTEILLPSESRYVFTNGILYDREDVNNKLIWYKNSRVSDFPENIKDLGSKGMFNKTNSTFDFPYVEIIGDSCFQNCFSISRIYIPNIKKIGKTAFLNIRHTLSIDFGELDVVPQIESNTFNNTYGSQISCYIKNDDALYDRWITSMNWSKAIDVDNTITVIKKQ